jgi:hypothetical protein
MMQRIQEQPSVQVRVLWLDSVQLSRHSQQVGTHLHTSAEPHAAHQSRSNITTMTVDTDDFFGHPCSLAVVTTAVQSGVVDAAAMH